MQFAIETERIDNKMKIRDTCTALRAVQVLEIAS